MPSNDNAKSPADDEISFSVMPQEARGEYTSGAPVPSAIPSGPQPGNDPSSTPPTLPEDHHDIWHSRATYMVIGLLVLLALAAGAYFMVGSDMFGKKEEVASRLGPTFLKQYFGVSTCAEQNRCGDTADPDDDGLQNFDELKEQTDPTAADTDKDGLADGDEVLIYLTDPTTEYTDDRAVAVENKYTDGSQVKNEYDPLTPGLKMTETRLAQIQSDMAKYQLHEPTISTLAKPADPVPKTVTVAISGNKFDAPSVTVAVNDSVTWVNRDQTPHQVASDPHPTHTSLPEMESGSLGANQTFTFKFTKTGTFTYHDHLNPTIKGTVIVQ